jgi:hypothetical protein
VTDWRDLFKRYTDVVGREEGVYFLYTCDWTEMEWRAIQALYGDYDEEQHAKDLKMGGPHRPDGSSEVSGP